MRTSLAVPLCLAVLAVGLLATRPAASAEAQVADVDVPTARGVALKASLHRPAAPNGTTVVLAPGQRYHRALPLMDRSAKALADAGFTVLRFDWAYHTAKAQAAEDLAPEIADVDAAVEYAKKLDGTKRVLLAGKSLGSVVAARWSSAHADALAGLALLTPPVTDPQDPQKPYEGSEVFAKLPLEPLVVCGDADPLADRRALYGLAARMEKVPQVVIVPGDHAFAAPSKAEAETLENVDLAARALVVWAKRQSAR